MALSRGELYTVLTNKAGRSKKGTLVALIKGTKSEDIIKVLDKLPDKDKVKEVTLDMAPSMEKAISSVFKKASLVNDRFHVVRLLTDALQKERIEYRWLAIKEENQRIIQAREQGLPYYPQILSNGDTLKQLLARSRYFLFKTPDKWTLNQSKRAAILFKRYPDLKKAYYHHLEFRAIYELQDKKQASSTLINWIEKTLKENHHPFYKIIMTIKEHFDRILNFFDNRSTNAFAESFNAKIKLFRANLRGVRNQHFFLFRLEKLFA